MDIEKELEAIKERNKRVEADKAWERSCFRIVCIMVVTYIIAALVLYIIGIKNFFASALIPTIGYLLSIQSLPFVKKWWINKYWK